MFARHSAIISPATTKKPGRLNRIFVACLDRIARYADGYAAAVHLHNLEDWALRDIGLVRSGIAAAVRGSLSSVLSRR